MKAGRHAIGFWQGFSSLFEGLRSLLRLSATWPYALVPGLVFLLLEVAFIALSIGFLRPWVQQHLAGAGALRQYGADAAAWLSVGLAAALCWVISAFLTPPLSAPALERIVGIVERDIAAPPRKPLGFLEEMACGLRAMLLSAAFTVPSLLAITLLELVFPPLAVATTPLKLLLGALGVAWGLFDYPLTLRGVGARQRLSFMRRHVGVVLGFGVAFALLFWLPCCGILFLPVGVAAATRLFWQIQRGAGASALALG